MNRKLIAIIVVGLVLLASLLACGFFGVKVFRRTRLRHAAMTAYENKEYLLAERLLRVYVQQDPNAETEYAALAKIYHELGNTGMEAQMWQTASSLNPLNPEYREKMLDSAIRSASYPLLYTILGRKVKNGENLPDRELYLFVIASYRSGYQKDGEEAYWKAVKDDPEAFRKNELGRMAEFMVDYPKLSEGERSDFLAGAILSEDPVIRFEGLYTVISKTRGNDPEESGEEMESLLKQLQETSYYAGTPLLADFYFSKFRFSDVIDVAGPYLKNINDASLSLLYAESCVFEDKPDELKAVAEKLRRGNGILPLLADYCDTLIAYLDDEDGTKLAAAMRKSGKLVSSPLSRFMRLRMAMEQDSFNEILDVAGEIFSNPPFHDLSDRALLVCLDYLSEQMEKQENQDDPSKMAELAKVLAGVLKGNQLLTQIILVDQFKRGLAKEDDLLTALEQFPDNLLLLQITAEFLLFNDKAELALSLLEQGISNGMDNRRLDFLHMLVLDQAGRHDEAATIFRSLVEQSEFDLNLLADYFDFCQKNGRSADLTAMAEKLETASDGKLRPLASYFRAAVLLSEDDEAKKQEALEMLAATSNDNADFTFFAANSLCEANMLDEAEAKYKAISNTYSIPSLIYVNLSELYASKGETEKALDAAKTASDMDKQSMLPAFIYAQRLSESGRYAEAVEVLKFPRHEVNYRDDVIRLWTDCMKKVIEKSIAEQRYLQAEEQCKHLLIIAPDDAEGMETLEKIREILSAQNKDRADAGGAPAA